MFVNDAGIMSVNDAGIMSVKDAGSIKKKHALLSPPKNLFSGDYQMESLQPSHVVIVCHFQILLSTCLLHYFNN